MVPSAILADSLGLTPVQRTKLARLVKVVDALRTERFAIEALSQLKLTEAQGDRIAAGEKVRTVLTETQRKVLDSNQRQGPPGSGFPGGGPGGGPPKGA